MKNSVLPVVRAAVAALPVKFNTMDVYAALPETKKTSVNTALEILLKRGDITPRPLESVQITVDGERFKGQRRWVDVRAFSRAANFQRVEGEVAASTTATTGDNYTGPLGITWTRGTDTLWLHVSTWPASPVAEPAQRMYP